MSVKSNQSALYRILLMVFVFFCILMVFAVYTVNIFKDKTSNYSKSEDLIAVVEVEGVIMESDDIVKRLHRAEKDSKVKAIILRVNSPGGAVGPTQEIYEEIIRIDRGDEKNKIKGKPIYASFHAIAASGGYYLAAGTRKIFSNAGSLTGSIGVIMNFMDLSKLYEWAKVKPEVIKAGKFKDVGNPSRSMKGYERDFLEGMLGNVHDQFINDILKRRAKKIKGDIRELAQGQIYSGEMAFKHGLVDEIAGLWGAGRSIHKELGLKGKMELFFVEKEKKNKFLKILDDMDESVANIKNLSAPWIPLFLHTRP